jgi:hypothetical protein
VSGPFEMLGDSGVPLCEDGVCAVPPATEAEPQAEVPPISAEAPPR